jgi:hypothetical protein
VTPGGSISETGSSLLAPTTLPGGIRTGPDGDLWFADNGTPQAIGQFSVGAPAALLGIGVTGGGDAGALQTCDDTWSDWAGEQPSRTALDFDGYRWLLDGSPIAGRTGSTYTPGAGDSGHQLSCGVTVTYTLFPVTLTATSTGVHVRGVDEQLDDLAAAVAGVGPGKSLAAKVHAAQAGDPCAALEAFANELDTQAGKHVPADTAAALLADASRVESLLAC